MLEQVNACLREAKAGMEFRGYGDDQYYFLTDRGQAQMNAKELRMRRKEVGETVLEMQRLLNRLHAEVFNPDSKP